MIVSRAFSLLVLRPLIVAHRVLGGRIWSPLERVAGAGGKVVGTAVRPLLNRNKKQSHILSPLLRFTDVVEGSLGIQGENELDDDGTATRTVHHCPFATSLEGTTEFCTRLGYVAGNQAFNKLVPGSSFEVIRTQSQGHPCCEYKYHPPRASK